MRDIKFRGQKEKTEEWVYGSVILNNGLMSLIIPIDNTYYSSSMMINEAVWVYTETISQYTGLKDKNGIEIYESDFVVSVDIKYAIGEIFTGLVMFYDGSWYIDNGKDCCPLFSEISEVTVLGNIYENKELLTD